MNAAEGKIRAALRETAEQIPSHSVPPLRLPQPERRRLLPRLPHGRHLPAWLPPLGVAAAVAAVVIGSLTAAHVIGGSAGPAGHHRMTRLPTPARVDGLPPYFIRWAGPARTKARQVRINGKVQRILVPIGSRLALYSTATGRAVATVTLPGRATALAAGGGAGTFFAAALGPCPAPIRGSLPCRWVSRDRQEVFYRITLTGAGAQVSVLPIRPVPGRVLDLSAAPDGRQLASATFSSQLGQSLASGAAPVVTVISTATGEYRNWTTTRPGFTIGGTSWLADSQRLAFLWAGAGSTGVPVLHLLDTSRPGGDALAGGAAVQPQRAGYLKDRLVSPDGSTVIATEERSAGQASPGVIPGGSVVSFPAGTGQPVHVLVAAGQHGQGRYWGCLPLWVSHTGQRVLVSCRYRPSGSHASQHLVLLAGPGRGLRRLPWLDPSAGAFTVMAFPAG